MFKDPIVEEVRNIRKKIEKQYPDSDSFFNYYDQIQKESQKVLTRRSPKRLSRAQAS